MSTYNGFSAIYCEMNELIKNATSVWVIGNGFDLACGYKTSYKDFWSYYADPKKVNVESTDTIKWIWEKIEPHKDKTWEDVEYRIGSFTTELPKNISPSDYLEFVNDLHKKLDNYLIMQQDGKPTDTIINKTNNVKKYFADIDIEKTVFIVLNYTDIFEKFIKSIYSDKADHIRLYYLHGNFKIGTIFGVGEKSQIKSLKYREDMIFSRQISKNELTGNYLHSDGGKAIWGQHINGHSMDVNFFGCSMGNVDRKIWFFLFFCADKKHKGIPDKFFYVGRNATYQKRYTFYKLYGDVFEINNDDDAFWCKQIDNYCKDWLVYAEALGLDKTYNWGSYKHFLYHLTPILSKYPDYFLNQWLNPLIESFAQGFFHPFNAILNFLPESVQDKFQDKRFNFFKQHPRVAKILFIIKVIFHPLDRLFASKLVELMNRVTFIDTSRTFQMERNN